MAEANVPNPPQIELRCRLDKAMLMPLREFVCNVAHVLGFSDQQVNELEICVDEACANAIEHAYPPERVCGQSLQHDSEHLRIEILFSEDELTVRVIDFGSGADSGLNPRFQKLEEYLDPARENYRGLGLYMVHKFMDEVQVKSSPGQGTTVEMKKIRR